MSLTGISRVLPVKGVNYMAIQKLEKHNQEYQLLSILLQYPDKIDEVADTLKSRHFLNPRAQLIYEILLNQFQRDNQISRTKLFLKLQQDGIIKNPEEAIESLTSGFNTVDEIIPTIELIKKDYQKHLLIKAARKIEELTMNPDLDIDQYQARAQELIFEATNETGDLEKHIYTRSTDEVL